MELEVVTGGVDGKRVRDRGVRHGAEGEEHDEGKHPHHQPAIPRVRHSETSRRRGRLGRATIAEMEASPQ
jgi:hypothetical protein